MDNDKRILLKKKLTENKLKLKKSKIEKKKIQIINCVDDFDSKYRFANETETERLSRFISNLNFWAPAHIMLNECNISNHQSMYLCFLCGTEELLEIYLYGNYNDFILDIDNWELFSPYLLLVDEDFEHFIYLNDHGDVKESTTK
ncbi:MAG: hypothetical protein J1E83_06180 [Lachnospiraceae bacterium]|nr:hypothetical protein [Lachnospiraceae bacterium]